MVIIIKEVLELEYSFDRLRKESRPIVLYGMGQGCEKILDRFSEYGIKASEIMASDEFVRGHSFRGYKVLKYSEVVDKYDDFVIVLAFGSDKAEVVERIVGLSQKHTLILPTTPICGETLYFDKAFIEENSESFEKLYNTLADDRSKELLCDFLKFTISGEVSYLTKHFSKRKEMYSLIEAGSNEVYVDLGAYKGDTVSEFLEVTNDKFDRIIAFEPDAKNYKKLVKYVEKLDEVGKKIECYNLASAAEKGEIAFSAKSGRQSIVCEGADTYIGCDSVDNILAGERATIIKFDVEGYEQEAIKGCKSSIESYSPRLLVSVYHKRKDLIELPKLILEYQSGYELYLRAVSYLPAWDLTLIAVAKSQ